MVDKFLANLRVPPFAFFFPKNYSTIKKKTEAGLHLYSLLYEQVSVHVSSYINAGLYNQVIAPRACVWRRASLIIEIFN